MILICSMQNTQDISIFNPEYALAYLLWVENALKSDAMLLFSTLLGSRQVHHSGAMP